MKCNPKVCHCCPSQNTWEKAETEWNYNLINSRIKQKTVTCSSRRQCVHWAETRNRKKSSPSVNWNQTFVHFRRPTLSRSNRFPSSRKINSHIHSFSSEMWCVRRHVVMFSSISVGKHWKVFSRHTWTEYTPSDKAFPRLPTWTASPPARFSHLIKTYPCGRFPGKRKAREAGLLLKVTMICWFFFTNPGHSASDGLITRWKSKTNVSEG